MPQAFQDPTVLAAIVAAIAAVVIALLKLLRRKGSSTQAPLVPITVHNTVTATSNSSAPAATSANGRLALDTQKFARRDKGMIRILFIDDDKKFKIIKILQDAGWTSTDLVTDIADLDAPIVRNADVIFVDIQGVGKKLKFADEGLGLVRALRERYAAKRICVYSAENSGDRFHTALGLADARLRKFAEPYEFITTIERLTE